MRFPCLTACLVVLGGLVGSADAEPLWDFKTGVVSTLAVAPDGSAVAYGLSQVASQEPGGEASLWVKPLPAGEAVRLPAELSNALAGSNSRPCWSPDGSRLAYLAQKDDERLYLHVWTRVSAQSQVFTAREVSRLTRDFRLQWSPDGRTVYYVAEAVGTDGSRRRATAGDDSVVIQQRLQLLFKDTEHGGITVLTSPSPTDAVDNSQFTPVDIVAADVRSGEIATIMTGAGVESMALAPDGKKLMVWVPAGYESGIRQGYYDLYVIPLPPVSRRGKDGKAASPKAGVPTIRKIKQFVGQGAWAPGSDRIAFAEQGALASGDISILDVATGQVRNLTAALELPSQLAPEDMSDSKRMYDYPGKFGQSYFPPLWSADGHTLFVLRRDAVAERKDLWAVFVGTGAAANLTGGSDFAATFPLRRADRIATGTTPAGAMLAVKFADGSGGFVEVDPAAKQTRTLARFRGNGALDWFGVSVAEGALLVTFLNEAADVPQEIFSLDLRDTSVRQATQVNQAYPAHGNGERKVVSWTGSGGRKYSGLIHLPPVSARAVVPLPPLIMVVYPRRPSELPLVLSDERFIGRSDLYLPPLHKLIHSGYAVMVPQIPTGGEGRTCEQVGANVVNALDAAKAAGIVDTARAAIMGHSFGGWTVNCVVTRTDRFKAAVSMSGISDFISMSFSSMPPANSYSVGGGQTYIGKSLWDAPQLYWAESPLSGLHNVQTPLLLIHGKVDIAVPYEQAVEMFVGLSKLGKTATLVGYDDAGHTGFFNLPDYEVRVTEWIGRYLGPAGLPSSAAAAR